MFYVIGFIQVMAMQRILLRISWIPTYAQPVLYRRLTVLTLRFSHKRGPNVATDIQFVPTNSSLFDKFLFFFPCFLLRFFLFFLEHQLYYKQAQHNENNTMKNCLGKRKEETAILAVLMHHRGACALNGYSKPIVSH